LTPTRFRECLAVLRWSQRGLADVLGRPEGTVRQWARGTVQIPDDVAVWLERAACWHVANPPPRRNRPEPREGSPR
jgi:DNA-binding transcriptional regulator YdaS (Cro superfamily)